MQIKILRAILFRWSVSLQSLQHNPTLRQEETDMQDIQKTLLIFKINYSNQIPWLRATVTCNIFEVVQAYI